MIKANIAKGLIGLIIKDIESQKPEHKFIERANFHCIENLKKTVLYCDALSIKKEDMSFKLFKRKIGEFHGILIKKLF